MKYPILLPLFLLLLLSACEERDDAILNTPKELTFGVTLDGRDISVQSRAAGIPDTDILSRGITVAGYRTDGLMEANPDAAYPNFFDQEAGKSPVQTLTKDASDKFKVGLTTQEVKADQYLSFFAWAQNAPAAGCGITGSVTDGTTKGFPYLDVTNAADPTKQNDVVAAQKYNMLYDYMVSAVDLDFKHVLSKLTFKTRTASGTGIVITKAGIKYGANKVYQTARYAYNGTDTIGEWKTYANYQAANSTALNICRDALPTIHDGDLQSLGEVLLIPQTVGDDFMTLEVSYKIEGIAGIAGQEVTRSIPLKGIHLQQNYNYVYTLVFTGMEVELTNPLIASWIDDGTSQLPIIPGPRGDVLLLIDGHDAPYLHTDGKYYWLDRSGYNHHCEISNNSADNAITYDATDKSYVFNTKNVAGAVPVGSFIKIPDLGTVSEVTAQLVVSGTSRLNDADYIPLFFTSNKEIETVPSGSTAEYRTFLTHIYGTGSHIYFDYGYTKFSNADGDRLQTPGIFANTDQQKKKSFFSFKRKTGEKVITRDGSFYWEEGNPTAIASKSVQLKYGAVGLAFRGKINYVKVMKKFRSLKDEDDDYQKMAIRFKITEDEKITTNQYLPPVKKGLMLCLDARTGVSTSSNIVSIWADQSIFSNHAANYEGSSSKWASEKKSITFSSDILKLVSALGRHQSFTLELVAKPTANSNSLISFQSSIGDSEGNSRVCHVHLPWTTAIAFNAPSANRIDYTTTTSTDPLNKRKNYCFIRDAAANKTEIRSNNILLLGKSDWTLATLNDMAYCYIGGQITNTGRQNFKGEVCTIRMYNRVLTAEEQKANYEYDYETFLRNNP